MRWKTRRPTNPSERCFDAMLRPEQTAKVRCDRAQLDVNGRAPRGTQVATEADRIFEDMVRMTKTPHMAETGWSEHDQYGTV